MANIIKPKRSNTAGNTPTTSNLASGELGVNMADQKTYINNGTAVVQIGAGNLSGLGDVALTSPTSGQSLSYNGTKWVNSNAGAGDVVGPSSATDNALVRFDGTTGKLIQNGTVTQDDTGNLSGILSEKYDTVTTPPTIIEALEAWDSGNGTLELGLKGGNVSYKYGQQEFVRAYNGSGSAMTKGQIVYIVGAQGNRVDVRLALANSDATSAGTIGWVAESIASGAEGWVQVSGTLPKLDTSTLTAGQALYLSPTTAGAYTTTRPTAPNHTVVLGWVERVSSTVGSVYIKVDNGYELDELHNVLITSPTSGNTLIYDAVAGVWKNANISAGTGISVTNGAGSISIANTGVTSVGATSPIASSGGATPTISISQATTSTNGYLSSTDWNTFNNKQPAGSYLTTVTASSPLSGSGTAGSPLVIAQSTTSTSGYLSNTDWNTFNGKQAALVSGTNIKTVNGTTLLGSGDVSVGVTSVTGTAPISSSGGATPAISISQASSTTNGYLSSTDWNTFNNKTSNTGTVTSVSATVPTGLSISGSPITTSGTLAITYTAGYSIPTTASQTNWDSAYTQRLQWDGGSTNLVASTGRTSLGGTTVGQNFFTLTNPTAITFPRINADNTVSALDATTFRTAIGAGTGSGTVTSVSGTAPISVATGTTTPAISISQASSTTNGYLSSTDWNTFNNKGSGTVTSVSGTGTVAGISLSGTVTSSGSLTLGGTFALPNGQVPSKFTVDTFTATASQTTFTTSTTYTSGKIQVFANGILMRNGTDVTVTSGTQVVFASGLAVGTLVDIEYFI